MNDTNEPLTEGEIRQLLESRWDELTTRAAKTVAVQVVWSRRLDRACTCVMAAVWLLACQIVLDEACLSKLQGVRAAAATASIRQPQPEPAVLRFDL